MRTAVEIGSASADDLHAVAVLCEEARCEATSKAQICEPDADRVAQQLGLLLALPGGEILLARQHEEVVGFALLRSLKANLFGEHPVVYLEALFVASHARRRGVGHALMAGAVEVAEGIEAPEVYSVPVAGSRGVQRFLARLGFAPLAGHRVVSVATLRRRLELDHAPHHRRGRTLEDLIARRRRAREEGASGPVDLRQIEAARARAAQRAMSSARVGRG